MAVADLRDRGKETWASEVKPQQDRLETVPVVCIISMSDSWLCTSVAPLFRCNCMPESVPSQIDSSFACQTNNVQSK